MPFSIVLSIQASHSTHVISSNVRPTERYSSDTAANTQYAASSKSPRRHLIFPLTADLPMSCTRRSISACASVRSRIGVISRR